MAGVEFPQIEFTQMIERVGASNRAGSHMEGVASASPLPTAQSADLGKQVEELPPLTQEERDHLDRMAVEAGVRDPRIGTVEGVPPTYGSLEEAIAAGASVNPPVVERYTPGMQGMVRGSDRQIAREFLATRSRLPDFRQVEGIDLLRGYALVDGMEFPISPEKAAEFKKFVVETARAAIMKSMEEAVGLFTLPETAEVGNGGSTTSTTSTVQQQSEGGSA